MAWTMRGTYVGTCNCALVCPCPVDQPPTAPNGECLGCLIFHVDQGNLDDLDFSGINWAMYNLFPSNLSAGNWKVGLVIDDGASDEQANAIQEIVGGQAGGPFADFAPLIGEFLGVERAKVSFSGGDSPSGSVEGRSEVGFEALTGPDGSPTTVKNAMFGFAPEFRIGKGSGKSSAFGLSYDARYGESADFEFSTELAGEIHPRA